MAPATNPERRRFDWTRERMDRVADLWLRGCTQGQIARIVGAHLPEAVRPSPALIASKIRKMGLRKAVRLHRGIGLRPGEDGGHAVPIAGGDLRCCPFECETSLLLGFCPRQHAAMARAH